MGTYLIFLCVQNEPEEESDQPWLAEKLFKFLLKDDKLYHKFNAFGTGICNYALDNKKDRSLNQLLELPNIDINEPDVSGNSILGLILDSVDKHFFNENRDTTQV